MALTTGRQLIDDNRRTIPDHVANILGLPYVGKIFYVDPTNGSDTTNSGLSPTDAYATVTNAEDDMSTHNHDVVMLVPGGTAGTGEAATITWDKSYCHLIGNTAPVTVSHRSRVVTTTDSVDPCWTISGRGNIFQNLQMATYQASNDVLVNLTGQRNLFKNVHFAGIGHATAGDDATARCMTLTGAHENRFEDCTFGLDTVNRSTTNATIEFASQPERNHFKNCRFIAYADNSGALFVKADSAFDIERWVIFEDCLFHNAVNSGATTMTVAMDLHTSLNGSVILFNSWLFGATDWADDFTNVEVAGGTQATGSSAGLMVAAS